MKNYSVNYNRYNIMLLVLLAPFIFSISVGFFGRFFGYIGSCIFANVGLFINLTVSLISFFLAITRQSYIYLPITDWVTLLESQINWNLCFDFNTLVMFIVVNGVSCVVHLFSASYMAADPHVVRFMSYISFFTVFMLILVTGDNLFQLFLGWEGVGLCSYLLISFWYTRIDAVSSGLKALIVNRISDFMLLCALLLINLTFYSLDFSILLAIADLFIFKSVYFTSSIIINLLFICCCLLLFGAMGKSAQILLHTWLPDAMEGSFRP